MITLEGDSVLLRQESIVAVKATDEILDVLRINSSRFYALSFLMSLTWMIGAMVLLSTAFTASECANCTMLTVNQEFPDDVSLLTWRTSFFMLGMMCGAIVMPMSADHYGRRPIWLVCLIGVAAASGFCAMSHSVVQFCVFRWFQGFFWVGASLVSWVAGYELAPPKLRAVVTLLYGLTWVVGYCLVAPLAMIVSTWREFYALIASLVPLYAFLIFLNVPETLHFLIVKRRARKAQRWIAHVDPTFPGTFDIPGLIQASQRKHKRPFLEEVLRHKEFIGYWLVQVFMWMTDTFTYFGLSLNSTQLDGNPYANFVLLGVVELPSYIFCPYANDYFGRKPTLIVSHISSGVLFIIAYFVQDRNRLIYIACWILGKFAISFSFMSLFVYTSEMFPSSIRNGAVGMCSVFAKIGGILIPYMKLMGLISEDILLIFLCVTAIAAGLLVIFLPETKNRLLPDTVEDEFENQS
ncbi:unnamed protein product [Caenorhabditis bovis]|uniref:Major facilitator superfamily (MFS) profile domain-containing protein n=1 Tax=Caenorhabditis bovis TaxID=2654633 RepID=A0A8S1EZM9_9PELO|nr:unnamed protein product [Caenorhabditis bovis]